MKPVPMNQIDTPREMSALHFVRAPGMARRAAKLLLWILILTPVALAFVPWQQSLSAAGRIIARDPTLREQTVEAPTNGRIIAVHVREGQHITAKKDKDSADKGTLLVSIRDPDPERLPRLLEQRTIFEKRRQASEDQTKSIQEQIQALEESREQSIAIAKQRLEIAKQSEAAAQQALDQAKASYQLAEYRWKQQVDLFKDNLTSELEKNQAEQQKKGADAELKKKEAGLLEAKLNVKEKEVQLTKVIPDFKGQINRANADLKKAEADLASAQAALTEQDTKIARQGTQEVYAPCDGIVSQVMVYGAGGGGLVKAGTPLIRIVPDVPEEDLIVSLTVDGVDAPLINELWQQRLRETGEKPSIPVRLQFEGYPAVQWVGWPSAAVGTFGGVIDFVDRTDDGKGNFRILVRRDPNEEVTNPWPGGHALRQGLRAKGWVLLNQVTLGSELWRRLNGFPPVVASEREAVDGKSKKPTPLKGLK